MWTKIQLSTNWVFMINFFFNFFFFWKPKDWSQNELPENRTNTFTFWKKNKKIKTKNCVWELFFYFYFGTHTIPRLPEILCLWLLVWANRTTIFIKTWKISHGFQWKMFNNRYRMSTQYQKHFIFLLDFQFSLCHVNNSY